MRKEDMRIECPCCERTGYARWILSSCQYSELEKKKITAQLYQCDKCKTMFTVPQLEFAIFPSYTDPDK